MNEDNAEILIAILRKSLSSGFFLEILLLVNDIREAGVRPSAFKDVVLSTWSESSLFLFRLA